ncbi:MAG: ferritin [Muribaculaceae bacterium]|nr:ferritin [Muribaculaceae bacterium]
MAKESIALLKGKVDVARVLDALNAALAEEWMAYYQYWTASKVVCGMQRVELQKEFMEHAEDELRHASMVIDRIIELGGVPVMVPQQWYQIGRCVYDQPSSFDAEYFLKAIRAAEECAMTRYAEIVDLTDGKDIITCDIARRILAEEADHEQDMQDYLDDMDAFRSYINSK